MKGRVKVCWRCTRQKTTQKRMQTVRVKKLYYYIREKKWLGSSPCSLEPMFPRTNPFSQYVPPSTPIPMFPGIYVSQMVPQTSICSQDGYLDTPRLPNSCFLVQCLHCNSGFFFTFVLKDIRRENQADSITFIINIGTIEQRFGPDVPEEIWVEQNEPNKLTLGLNSRKGLHLNHPLRSSTPPLSLSPASCAWPSH